MWRWRSGLPLGEGASTSNSDPPDGITKISDSVYALREPGGPPEIEIVFIHGLQLSDYSEAHWRTWIAGENDTDGRETCWPMAWLGEELPGARILSLKYDSCILRTNTTGTMDGFLLGESLVQEMVGMANIGQQKNCPVVFVCHSVGGLVAKEIVIKAHRKFGNEPKYLNFLQNIRGFHFYATPHEGSKLADLAKRLPYMGEMVDLLRVINKELGRLNDEFARIERDHYSNKWRFSVVAETHMTTCYGFSAVVVEEASARHVYSNFLCVSADHFGVCKPRDRASSSYVALKKSIEEVLVDNKVRKDSSLKDLPSIVVGMHNRVEEVRRTLEGHSVVALVGMGGVGKTTLSKYIYNEEKDHFEGYCFLDVKSSGNIEAYQRDLFRDLCGERWNEDESVSFHLMKIKQSIMSKKVLLVVDDVGNEENMKALQVPAFSDGKKGSKVIVTTRHRDIVLDFVSVEGIIDVDFLTEGEALELFSYYAFRGVEESVRVRFDGQAREISKACGKLPLSLEVIGQYLRKYNHYESIEKQMRVWEEALQRLKEAKPFDGSNDDRKLWARLKISYDDLNKDEQSIFLDMVCIMCKFYMFDGENRSRMLCRATVEQIWNKSLIGIENLTNRSLIKWSAMGNTLVIHDQLQDMACGIVRDEVDGNKSRVWDLDGLQSMIQKEGFKTLQGLYLGMVDESLPMFERFKIFMAESLNMEGSKCFEHLRLLGIERCGHRVVRDYINLCTEKLIWLGLNGTNVTKKSLRGLRTLKNVRVLHMIDCKILKTIPTAIGNLSLLTELDLSYCSGLKSLPESIGKLDKLQLFRLYRCFSLKTLPTSIGNLSLLEHLDLSYCRRLESLPESIGKLDKLQVLGLYRCTSLKTLPTSIGNLSLLTEFDLSNCGGLESLSESIGKLDKLQLLELYCCYSLKTLPTCIGNLFLLKDLDLSYCGRLESLPESISKFHKLQAFSLFSCSSLKTLPTSIGNLSLLENLDLSYCSGLESLPKSIGKLDKLRLFRLYRCFSLKTLPTSIGNLSALENLDLSKCGRLESLPESIGKLDKLQVLGLHRCLSLKTLPTSIGNLSLLKYLHLSECDGLESLPESIGKLDKLQLFVLYRCSSLKTLPTSIGNLSLLENLDLSYSDPLESLPESINKLHKLQVLSLYSSSFLKTLPISIGNLSLLINLDLSYCGRLESLPESIGELDKLQLFRLDRCSSLKTLPTSIGNLSLLENLDLSYCGRLESLSESISKLDKLQLFKLDHCSSLKTLPTSIGNLSLLKNLDLSYCGRLENLPESIGKLDKLQLFDLDRCSSLKTLPTSIGNLSLLKDLDLSYCDRLENLPESIGKLDKLQLFRLDCCSSLKTLPTSIGNLSLVKNLDLSYCGRLESLPESISKLDKLQLFRLDRCSFLKTLPTSIGNLSLLKNLDLSYCSQLKSLPESIGKLDKLQLFRLYRCFSLKTLPTSIGNLSLLENLDLSYCSQLKSLPESIGKLHKLQVFSLYSCSSLKTLPTSIGNLSLLENLDLSGCGGLESLPESISKLHKL